MRQAKVRTVSRREARGVMGQRRQGREARASGEPGGVPAWHSQEPAEVLAELAASAQGLTDDQAAERLERPGPNRLPAPPRSGPLRRFPLQFPNMPIHWLRAPAPGPAP